MAKEKKHLTARERQCQKVAREKAFRVLVRNAWRRVRWWLAGGVLVPTLLVSSWFIYSGGMNRLVDRGMSGVYAMTAAFGFRIDTLYLEGRDRTPMADIRKALGVKKGTPILSLSLTAMRARLEALEHVKEAAVERALPGTLYVRIQERQPVAVWQYQGKLTLVDEEGVAMPQPDVAAYRHLPLVVGEGAPGHVHALLAMLAQQPDLLIRVKAAVRVGERRWDIRLKKGIEVKLPDENMEKAWQALAQMQKNHQLLDRDVRQIDMRAADRVYIKLAPGAIPRTVMASAKET